VPITGPARVRPAIDGDVEFIRHRVVNTVLHDIGRTAPGELIVAIEWLIPRVNAMPGITWKTARDVAWRESMLRFGKPGTSHSAWMLAARLRAFAALMDRVSGRLLIDVGWIRAQLDRGMDKNGVLADLIQRHKRILDEEISVIWKALETFYYQGPGKSPLGRPTRDQFMNNNPPAVRRWDKEHPIRRLAMPQKSIRWPDGPMPAFDQPWVTTE